MFVSAKRVAPPASLSERLADRTELQVLSQLITRNDRFRTQPVKGFVITLCRRGVTYCFVSAPRIYFISQEPLMFRAGHAKKGDGFLAVITE